MTRSIGRGWALALENADRLAAAGASLSSLTALIVASPPDPRVLGARPWMWPATAVAVLAASGGLALAGAQLRGSAKARGAQGVRWLLPLVPIAVVAGSVLDVQSYPWTVGGELPVLTATALVALGVALLAHNGLSVRQAPRRLAAPSAASAAAAASSARPSPFGLRAVFHVSCLFVLGVAWFSLVSFCVAKGSELQFGAAGPMLPGAIGGLGVLAFGSLRLRANEGLFGLLRDRGPAGATTRLLLPLGAGLPLLLGLVIVAGYRAGRLDMPLGFALFSTLMTFGLLALSWLGSKHQRAFELERNDSARQRDALSDRLSLATREAAESAERDRRRFQAIFDTMFQAIFVLSPDGRLLEANRTALGLWGSAEHLGQPLWLAPAWRGEAATLLQRAVERAANGHFVRYTSEFAPSGGSTATFDFSILPLTDSQGNAQHLILEARDITEIEAARKALLESEDRFARAIQYSAIGMALVDLQGRWLRVNPMLCEILGRSEQELLAVTFQDITHAADLQTDLDLMAELLAGEISHYHMEKRYLGKDGAPVWCLLSVSLVRTADGDPRYFVSQVQDISQRKAAEAETQQSLREKEVLLREIHHRVKNNLQLVTSILRLARAKLTDPVHQELFDECQGRVRSMGLIHEQLYRAEALGRIDFAEHLRQLCQLARQMWGSASKVEFALDLQSVWLDLDTAVPLGLIANEVISNAFKHAFPGGRAGKVTIALGNQAAVLSLSIRDNGVGMSKHFDLARCQSLGMRIVANLARQIRGEFELLGEGGVEFRLRMGSSEPALERGAA